MSGFDARARLPSALQALGLPLDEPAREQLLGHLSLLAQWGRVYNLTALREPAEMFTHHLLDSLAAVGPLLRHLCADGGAGARPCVRAAQAGRPIRLLDVGSGAGLPGVVFAIALPQLLAAQCREPPGLEVVCIDSVAKKAGFIRQVAAQLGLRHLSALHGRVEAAVFPVVDVITCRAFASLPDIVALSASHLAADGVWMALKGTTPNAELAELPEWIDAFHVEPLQVPGLDAQRCLVWMRPRRDPTGAHRAIPD